MLGNQSFSSPPLVLIGKELFYDKSAPYEVNIQRVADFSQRIASPGNFTFFFLGYIHDYSYYERLIDFRVPFKGRVLTSSYFAGSWRTLNQYLRTAELAYAPEILSDRRIKIKLPCTFLEPAGVMDCLQELAMQPIPFTRSAFAELENKWVAEHK